MEHKYVWREGDKIMFPSGNLSRGEKWPENLKWAIDHGFTVIEKLPNWYVRINAEEGSHIALVRIPSAAYLEWCRARRKNPAEQESADLYRKYEEECSSYSRPIIALGPNIQPTYTIHENIITDPETIKTLIGADMSLAPKKPRNTKAMVEKAAKQAAIVAVSMQGEEILFQWAKGATEKHWPEVLKTPFGEAFIRLAAPVALHYVLETYGEAIPQHDKLLTLCEGATQGNIQRNIGHLFTLLQPLLAQVANLPTVKTE